MAHENLDIKSQDPVDILARARHRLNIRHSDETHIREAALEDIKFTYNIEEGQWPDEIRNQRKRDKRPCLTSNKLRKFVSQVANRERDARNAIDVRPVDSKGDVVIAKILKEMIRTIEYNSKADEIYANEGEKAIAGGFGYWRILTKFNDDDGFEQDILLEGIENQFAVYLDPRRMYGFIREGIPAAEFKIRYPKAQDISFESQAIGEEYTLWFEPDKVFVVEYFEKVPVTKTLVQFRQPGDPTVHVDVLSPGVLTDALTAEGFEIIRTRKVESHKVMWYKMNGVEILESREWVGSEIPIIEVVGDFVQIQGRDYKRSLIRDGKDPQRMYNYWVTTMTEDVALTPKVPYLVTPEQIENHESMWNGAGEKNLPYLLYNASGQAIPKRESQTQVPTGAAFMLQLANNDIQDTIGMFEASFGQKSNERTGRAIGLRAGRSDLGTFHFSDNLRRAILETARQFIDIIPKVYDTERDIRIRNEENEEEFITINKKVFNIDTKEFELIRNLSIGKYDVRADVKSVSTRRQEALQFIETVLQSAPQVSPLLLDLFFELQDLPGADEVAKRVKQFLPQLMGGAQGGGGNAQPAEVPQLT